MPTGDGGIGLDGFITSISDNLYDNLVGYYPAIPFLLIAFTIIFIYLYTYYSLFRINRHFFLKGEKAKRAFDPERKSPKIAYYICASVVIVGLFIAYFFIKDMDADVTGGGEDALFAPPGALFFGALPCVVFLLAFIGLLIFQFKIIKVAESRDFKESIRAFGILIAICLLLIFLANGNKTEYNEVLFYLGGFFVVFLLIHLLYVISLVDQFKVKMANERLDTLSKVCLLGTKGTVETTPYNGGKGEKKMCECKDDSFQCMSDIHECMSEKFAGIEPFDNPESSSSSSTTPVPGTGGIPESEEIKEVVPLAEDEKGKVSGTGEDLKISNGIPIQFYNNNIARYDNLCIRDFYYMGSYFSYLANSPENGIPDLDALRGVIRDFKCRIVHLDIYSSLPNNVTGTLAEPIVRSEVLAKGREALKLADCLEVIRKEAWADGENSLPLFLYLAFHVGDQRVIYQKTYQLIDQYLGKYLVDKKYGFNERQHTFKVAAMPIAEGLGKCVLLTNIYPTYTILDEVINCNAGGGDLYSSIQMKEYKREYMTYDKQGLLVDSTKNQLIDFNRSGMSFYYTLPNPAYDQNAKMQSKAGIFNPRFGEVAKYGAQSALMNVYVPDLEMERCFNFFQVNPQPVLKRPFLRYIRKTVDEEIESITKDMNGEMASSGAVQALASYNFSISGQ